jgi:hypothetical protein
MTATAITNRCVGRHAGEAHHLVERVDDFLVSSLSTA